MFCFFAFKVASLEKFVDFQAIPLFIYTISTPKNPLKTYDPRKLGIFNSEINKQTSIKRSLVDYIYHAEQYDTGIRMIFNRNNSDIFLFETNFNFNESRILGEAIRNDAKYHFIIDNISFWCDVGFINEEYTNIYTNFAFSFNISNGIIVGASVKPNSSEHVMYGEKYSFTCETEWREINQNRNDMQMMKTSFSSKLMITTASVFAVSTGIVICIIAKITKESHQLKRAQTFDDFNEPTPGDVWRALHSDIFRLPENAKVLAILTGAGSRVILTLSQLFLWSQTKNFRKDPSATFIVLVSAFVGSSIFDSFIMQTLSNMMKIKDWIATTAVSMIVQLSFYGGCYYLFDMKSKGCSDNETTAILITLASSVAFAFLGSFIAVKGKMLSELPHEPALIPKVLPKIPFYCSPMFLCIINTCIGFIITFVCTPYIVADIAEKVYLDCFRVLMSCFILLISIVIAQTIFYVFKLLKRGYWKWQWKSFIPNTGYGIGAFVALLALIIKSNVPPDFMLASLIQALVLSCGIFVACGAIGFIVANCFIFGVFSNLKVD